MAERGDGDGWVECACGRRHWGRYGAAGLLLQDEGRILLQHRAYWSHEGGTWGLPGGARDSDESPLAAALREAAEETGVDRGLVRPTGQLVVDHGTWSYTSVVAVARGAVAVSPQDAESEALAWVRVGEVPALPLHSGFAATWPVLAGALGARLTVVVDGANVVGSRPDGWWRDRAGAAGRLRDALARLAGAPVPDAVLPEGLGLPPLTAWYVEPVLVVEGLGRALPPREVDEMTVVRAADSGDDAVAEAVARRVAVGASVLAVTADRELARRVQDAGGVSVGPRWLLGLLAA